MYTQVGSIWAEAGTLTSNLLKQADYGKSSLLTPNPHGSTQIGIGNNTHNLIANMKNTNSVIIDENVRLRIAPIIVAKLLPSQYIQNMRK